MEVKQIYTLMNSVTSEILGTAELLKEDLTNVVDFGTELFSQTSVDNYVKSLVNHIGKVIFVNRPYMGSVPSVMRDSWEFGSVLEKISAELPDASENESWDLVDGQEYKTDIFYKPKVSAKFYNSKVTFEIPMSFTERQVKESFNSASQLNGFLSMIYNAVNNSMTIKMDALIMRTINSMTALTIADSYPTKEYASSSTIKAVNLLKEYNDLTPETPEDPEDPETPKTPETPETPTTGGKLTPETAIFDPDFIRFASYRMALYANRMTKISTLFNIGGKERFTPSDKLSIVMLADFKKACETFLQSDVFHDSFVALPSSETVPYWQGSGKDYGFDSVSTVHVKIGNSEVNLNGILAVMFDRDALGVCNTDRRVTTAYNAKGEFFNNFYKFDASYFNDENENFVVFFIA